MTKRYFLIGMIVLLLFAFFVYAIPTVIISPSEVARGQTVTISIASNISTEDLCAVEIRNPQEIISYLTQVNVSPYSTVDVKWRVPSNAMLGLYKVYVSCRLMGNTIGNFRVKEYSTITINLDKASTYKGDKIKIYGTISPSPGTGYAVKIYYRKKGTTSWNLLGSNTTLSDGSYMFYWNTGGFDSGTYELKASWSGSDLYFGSESSIKEAHIDLVIVQLYMVDDERIDINSVEKVYAKLIYESDGAIVNSTTCSDVKINGTSAIYDSSSGTWYITVSESSVKLTRYYVTSVNEIARNIGGVFEDRAPQPAQIIWDRVVLQKYIIEDDRVNVNSTQIVYVRLEYDYDNQPLTSATVTLNGMFTGSTYNGVYKAIEVPVTNDTIGVECYRLTSFIDNLYGLTELHVNASPPCIIWDAIIVTSGRVSDDRADIKSVQKMFFKLEYAYDGAPFNDSGGRKVYIAGEEATYSTSEWYIEITSPVTVEKTGSVTGVDDPVLGITAIIDRVGPLSIIFDRVLFEVSADKARIEVGKNATIRVKAYYEFDKKPFVGTYQLNEYKTEFNEPKVVNYYVISMDETKYGLTAFISTTATVHFDKLKISWYEVNNNLGNVRFRVIYASDGTPISGGAVNVGGVFGVSTITVDSDGFGGFSFDENDIESGIFYVTLSPKYDNKWNIRVSEVTQIPVKKLQFNIKVDVVNQEDVHVKIEPTYSPEVADVEYLLNITSATKYEYQGRKISEFDLVFKPGLNTIRVSTLIIHDNDIIVIGKREALSKKLSFLVSLAVEYENLVLSTIITEHEELYKLTGNYLFKNNGNVTLDNLYLEISIVKNGKEYAKFKRKLKDYGLSVLKSGDAEYLKLDDLDIDLRTLEAGTYNVTNRITYYEGLNLVEFSFNIVVYKRIEDILPIIVEASEAILKARKEASTILKGYGIEMVDTYLANEFLKKAYEAFKAGNVDEAEKYANQAIDSIKSSRKAFDMFEKIVVFIDKWKKEWKDYLEMLCLQGYIEGINDLVKLYKDHNYKDAIDQLEKYERLAAFVEKSEVRETFELLVNAKEYHPLLKEHLYKIKDRLCEAFNLAMDDRVDDANAKIAEANALIKKMIEVSEKIKAAETAIKAAERDGRTIGLDGAKQKYNEALEALKNQRYDDAISAAEDARTRAERAISPVFVATIGALVGIPVLIIAGYFVRKWVKKKRIERELKEVEKL